MAIISQEKIYFETDHIFVVPGKNKNVFPYLLENEFMCKYMWQSSISSFFSLPFLVVIKNVERRIWELSLITSWVRPEGKLMGHETTNGDLDGL